ncbi:MAG: PepSY domain-containing protein [Defluviitaleaceae bacterium]|nr:PepSY domain-containing protein [Defluviitaleaceae bacterium]
MLKKIITMTAIVAIMAAGYVGFSFLAETPTTQVVQAAQPAQSVAEMQTEIAELRALIQALLTSLGQTQATPVAQISSQRAREIAIEFTGEGTALSTNLFTEDGTLTFEVEVQLADSTRYMVYVNAITAAATRMTRLASPQPTAPPVVQAPPAPVTPAPAPAPANISGNRNNRPTNPAITRERAIQIAENDMRARGLSGFFDSIELDWELGQWVWEIEFDSATHRSVDYEWYINVDTGAIVRFRIDW